GASRARHTRLATGLVGSLGRARLRFHGWDGGGDDAVGPFSLETWSEGNHDLYLPGACVGGRHRGGSARGIIRPPPGTWRDGDLRRTLDRVRAATASSRKHKDVTSRTSLGFPASNQTTVNSKVGRRMNRVHRALVVLLALAAAPPPAASAQIFLASKPHPDFAVGP